MDRTVTPGGSHTAMPRRASASYAPKTCRYGIARSILLTRATDKGVHEAGQDGGLVSTLLIWGLENEMIDGALTSQIVDKRGPFDSEPFLARTKEDVLAAAGSRYTYSANPLAMAEADDEKLKQIALVGMSCQASINGSVGAYGVAKYKRKIALTIGLLCSKTFTYDGQREVLAAHGIAIEDVTKINVKGRYMVWTRDGGYHEIPLKECHAWTREGCTHCPDFAAEHADISTGGIGKFNDWTLTIVRTDLGREIMIKMLEQGVIYGRPGDDDPGAIALLRKLSAKSRKRWPDTAVDAPRLLPPPAPKAEPAATPA